MDDTLSEQEKINALNVLHNVSDGRGAVDNYYQNIKKEEYSKQLDAKNKELKGVSNTYDEAKRWGQLTAGVSEEELAATVRDKKILYLYMSGDKSVSKFQAENAFDNLYKNGKMSKNEKEGYKNAMAALRGENSEKVPKYYKKKVNQMYEQYKGYAENEKEYQRKYDRLMQEKSDIEALYNKDYGNIEELLYGR